jgi:hypothetical protein
MNRVWWKAYFFLAVALTVLVILFPLLVDDEAVTDWSEWWHVPLYVVQLVGLFGFAFWRRIAMPRFWQIAFIASVAYETYSFYSTVVETGFPTFFGNFFFAAVIGVSLLLQAPLLIALFLYGFRCHDLWNHSPAINKMP